MTIDSVISRAIRWMLQQQYPDGSWRADFGFLAGISTSWSTAYVINSIPKNCDKSAVKKAIQYLTQTSRPHTPYGGKAWGFNESTPVDLDSTLEALRALPLSTQPTATPFLKLMRGDNGFATYMEQDLKNLYPTNIGGWCSSHLEIATNILLWVASSGQQTSGTNQLFFQARKYVLEFTRANGYRAYWYEHPLVAASFVLYALGKLGCLLPSLPNLNRIDFEVLNNPFVTACAIEAAYIWDKEFHKDIIHRLTQRLIDTQRPDGSWRPLPFLRVPYLDSLDPKITQHINGDFKRPIITVARIIAALSLYKERK